MESTTKQGMSQEKPTETPVTYTAVGCVAGTYQPSPDDFEHGSLLTEDGQTIWAELHWHLRNQLKQKGTGLLISGGWMSACR